MSGARPTTGRTSDAGNAAEKTVRLLEAATLPGGPHLLGEIARAARVPKASAHRILHTLVANGFLCSDGAGRYPIGPRLRSLAATVDAASVGARVEDLLADLSRRTGQTVHLALRTGDTATRTHQVGYRDAARPTPGVGTRMSLHATAIGRCVLAGLPGSELASILSRTPADQTALRAELDRVSAAGFALADEDEPGVRCLAAPVHDRRGQPIGAVGVSALALLVPPERMLDWSGDVIATANAVAARLG